MSTAAENLRKSILQYAIEGKLLPQNPQDESAYILMNKIKEERHKLERRKLIKKTTHTEITKEADGHYYEIDGEHKKDISNEIGFDLPDSWCVCRLLDIANIFVGNSINEQEKARKYTNLDSGYNYIGTKDVSFDHSVAYENGVKIPYETDFRIAHKGTPLLCIEGGSAGRKICILNQDVCFGNKLCAFESYGVNTKYLYYFLQNPRFKKIFASNTSGIIGGVNIKNLSSIYFFMPPKHEQERIVEELDRYEPLLTEYEKLGNELSNLDVNIHDKLRRSILQYAVEGKLIPQNSDDEPAAILLSRIVGERKRLVANGSAKKGKSISYITVDENGHYSEKKGNDSRVIDDDIPFEIPCSWVYIRLGDVIDLISGQDLVPDKYNSNKEGIPYITGASNFVDGEVIINRWTKYPKSISVKGDLLITCKGTIGAFAYNTADRVHIARQIMAIRPILVDIRFIKIVLESKIDELGHMAKSIIPGIKRESVEGLLVALPPIEEQKRIVEEIEKYESLLDRLGKLV